MRRHDVEAHLQRHVLLFSQTQKNRTTAATDKMTYVICLNENAIIHCDHVTRNTIFTVKEESYTLKQIRLNLAGTQCSHDAGRLPECFVCKLGQVLSEGI